MTVTVHPVSPAIGAEIRGVDISKPIDAASFAIIHKAWLDHSVLLFRGQTLDPDQQRAFVSLFGTIGVRSAALRPEPDHERAETGSPRRGGGIRGCARRAAHARHVRS